jgi:riboflavin synthase
MRPSTGFDSNSFSVDLSPETLKRTNLGSLKSGDPVNLERPLGLGGELGGHLVQGHVDNTGRIVSFTPEGGATIFRIEAPADIMRYVVEKGFIAVDGISLTITPGTGYFQVSVITTLGKNHSGNTAYLGPVNWKLILAKYAEQFMLVQRPKLMLNT